MVECDHIVIILCTTEILCSETKTKPRHHNYITELFYVQKSLQFLISANRHFYYFLLFVLAMNIPVFFTMKKLNLNLTNINILRRPFFLFPGRRRRNSPKNGQLVHVQTVKYKHYLIIIVAYFCIFIYRFPARRKATIVNRSPHNPCHVSSHMNDLINVLNVGGQVRQGRSLLVLIADGGPDFNVNHVVNEMYYGRLFKQCKLDALVATSYCPGHSALNPVERLWAPCTRALTSASIPAALPGERPPCHQSGLTKEAKLSKEKAIFNKAMADIEKYWATTTYAGKPIHITSILSGADDTPFNDFSRVHAAVSSSATRLREDAAVYNEFRFTMRHMDRRIGMVIFAKCTDPACQHCSSNPPVSEEMLQCVRNFPTPKPSSSHPGHFLTFIDALHQPRDRPCEHMPLFQEKSLGRCEAGCKYVFTSRKDKDDHRKKVHPRR